MKMFLLSDNNDTLTGMRLAGVYGRLITENDSFKEVLEKTLQMKDLAILLLTNELNEKHSALINEKRREQDLPLIITIPSRDGLSDQTDHILKYIQEAIGIKL